MIFYILSLNVEAYQHLSRDTEAVDLRKYYASREDFPMGMALLDDMLGSFPEISKLSAHILLASPLDLVAVRRHLRKFLMVCLPGGRITYFRFYDPRVLNVFLPTCTPLQLRRFFGPIETFWAQDEEEPHYNRYRLEDGRLVVSAVDIDDLGRDDR